MWCFEERDEYPANPGVEFFCPPLWALQEEWPRLEEWQRAVAASRGAFHGDLAVLASVVQVRRLRPTVRMCKAAAAGGQLVALQVARALGCRWDEWTCYKAARGGHLAVL